MARSTRRGTSNHAIFLLAAVIAATVLSAGCATPAKRPPGDIVWPRPPEVARIRYIRSFGTPEDVKPSFLRRLVSVLVPMNPRARIQQVTGLALSPDEKRLYAACAPLSRIVRVDLASGAMDTVMEEAKRPWRLPYGIALDANENAYVSDKLLGVVRVFDRDGKFIREFGRGVLEQPMYIALDRKRQLLYVVNGAAVKATQHRIEVFSLKGEHLRTMGRRGHGPGEFNLPTHVAVAPDGNLFFSDTLNFRVQVFTPEGEPAGAFGQVGMFDKIKGIGFDTFGNIYIADTFSRGIYVFNSRFQPLLEFSANDFIKSPSALVVNSRNEIFVGDFAEPSIQQYALVNTTAADSFAPKSAVESKAGASPAAVSSPAPVPASSAPQPSAPSDASRPSP